MTEWEADIQISMEDRIPMEWEMAVEIKNGKRSGEEHLEIS